MNGVLSRTCAFLTAVLAGAGCGTGRQEIPAKMFTVMPPDSTGIFFVNRLHDTPEVNATFEFRYNGCGVGVGDIDNDGLPDLFFTANDEKCRLYLNKGGMHFEDITESAGILPRQSLSTGVQMVDINADGFLDIYVCRTGPYDDPARRANQLYINNGDRTFTERAAEYGLDNTGYSNHSAFFDYDRDGDLDVYIVNGPLDNMRANDIKVRPDTDRVNVSDRLLRNEGDGTFRDVTFQAHVGNKAHGFNPLVIDINRDGWPDIYVSNDFIQPDYLYINNHDGTFTESMARYFMHMSASSMGCFAGDINNDGLPDIVEVDMMAEDNRRQKLLMGPMNYDQYDLAIKYGYQQQVMRNQLHLNNGDGTFSEIAHLAGMAHTDWSWTPLIGDFDNDGWNDLFISNGYRRDLTDMDYRTFLLDSINRSGGISRFRNVFEILNMLPATPLRNYFYRNRGDLSFENVSSTWVDDTTGFSNGAVYADLDGDGDLDIVVNNIDGFATVYRNNARQITGRHYIRLVLEGTGANRFALGSCIEVTTSAGTMSECNNQAQGYYSSLENAFHFGLGDDTVLARAVVTWPDGRVSVLENVGADRTVIVKYASARLPAPAGMPADTRRFERLGTGTGIDFVHAENDFVDFKREPLLLQKNSVSGPCLARGDVNGDGLDDLFAGNAAGAPAALFLQRADGTFSRSNTALWEKEKDFEDTGALFFDADGDGDADLVVCGGGSEWEEGSERYRVRFYRNDGHGALRRDDSPLPVIHTSCEAVAGADIDGDGDTDLFIGGRVVPGKYPLAPRSYVLVNEHGAFADATARVCPALERPGLVMAAVWTDLDGNGQPDLVVAGHWMPLRLFINRGGILRESTADAGLDTTSGWWNSVAAADMDGDGDIDLVAGNLGLNARIKGTGREPVTMYVNDFDGNGNIDAVMCMHYQGVSYPVARRETMLDQVRMLQPKFTRYTPYANATIYDLFPREQVDQSTVLHATLFASCVFENKGSGRFTVRALPRSAQVAPVNAILCADYNGDGKTDMLMTGNCYGFDVESGRCDAFTGLLLEGDGAGHWTPVPSRLSGFHNQLDARSLVVLDVKGVPWIVTGNNNDSVRVFRVR